jgi:hypothetical protein
MKPRMRVNQAGQRFSQDDGQARQACHREKNGQAKVVQVGLTSNRMMVRGAGTHLHPEARNHLLHVRPILGGVPRLPLTPPLLTRARALAFCTRLLPVFGALGVAPPGARCVTGPGGEGRVAPRPP